MSDSIDKIQFRHDHTLIIDWYKETAPAQPQTAFNGAQCHDDRGYLLKEIHRLREGIERLASPEAFLVARSATGEEMERMHFARKLLEGE